MGDDVGHLRVLLFHILRDGRSVGQVAQVDDEVLDVGHRGTAVGQEGTDVLQKPFGLAGYVSHIDDLAVIVDAGRTRDEVLVLAGQGHPGAALESHTVLMGRVQVVEGLEIEQVVRLDAGGGQEVDGHADVLAHGAAANAGTGNEVGVDGEAVLAEHVVAGLDDAVVVGVDIAHVNPGPDAMVLQVQSLLLKQGKILVEEHDGLHVGTEVHDLVVGKAQAVHGEGVLLVAGLQQHANLRTANGRLLDKGIAGGADVVGHQR